ncbi:glycosyltransferase [uncultured Chitinophaga sp.]|uniref:glycosyltransferase n=1 Tax=uncultured Chitinophaga sp. TaxID=339340 RepID=UPI0025DAFA2B|nr:glycosyltransferase [uncultured Chitinophaga sp.]
MEDLVSVVFTSYNHIEYLEQALDSIVNQTYRQIEVIVVDDCSTDGSQEVLKRYGSRSNVQLHLLEKNTGSYVKASNYGASYAKGKYILFAQCDDYCEPIQIARLVAAFNQHLNAGVVFSRSKLVDEHGTILTDDFEGREKRFREQCATDALITGAEMRAYLSYSCVIPNLSAAMVRRDLYEKVGGLSDRYRMAADWAFWLDLAELTNFFYITEPLNYFRQHATTIRSKTKIVTQVAEIYTIFYDHINRYKLAGREKSIMKRGAGAIWGWYAIDSPKAWWSNLPTLMKVTFGFEKMNLYYLSLGCVALLREKLAKSR